MINVVRLPVAERSSTEQILSMLREHYANCGDAVVVSSTELATAVHTKLDPSGVAPPLISWAAFLEFKQLARGVLRDESSKPSEVTDGQSELFIGLHLRYPTGDDEYTLRRAMTAEQRRDAARRIRQEGRSKIAHADALDAETDALIRAGTLSED